MAPRREAGAAWPLLLAAAVAAVLLAGCAQPEGRPQPTPTPTATTEPTSAPQAATEKIASPAEGAYLGVFHPPAPFDISSLEDYAEVSDKPPAILMWFQPWSESGVNQFDAALVVSAYQRGAVPMLTWEPWNPGADSNFVENPAEQTDYRLQRIIDGEFDAYIRSWARGIADVGGPVMLRPMHEMNGRWYPWSGTVNDNTPEQFVQAWRRVHGIFAEEGATNVTWVWSINWESRPDTPDNAFELYYPGDEYVDWCSISGFNWGTSRPSATWQTFDEIYTEPLAYLRTVGKPIVLSEFASVPDGGDKAAWITDAYDRIRTQHPEIDAVVYYDKLERGPQYTQAWQITSSEESARAFSEAVADDYFLPAIMPELTEWRASISEKEWARLRSIVPIY